MRVISVLCFALMVAGSVGLTTGHTLLAREPIGIAAQAAAVSLMIWARLTLGRRSFHAAADPTAGGLVTTGPYRYLRHPIYAAVLCFAWSTAIDHHSWQAL